MPAEDQVTRFERQRDFALGCAGFSVVLSCSLVLSYFPERSTALNDARALLVANETLLDETRKALHSTKEALAKDKQALESLKAAAITQSK